MKQLFFLVLASATLAACSSARDERLNVSKGDRTPIAHNTIVDCPVLDGMTKTSAVLSQTSTGAEVQVTDTINAYFVRVRASKDGKSVVGYMDRRCFGERGDR